jgi:hypothetical protein
MPRGRLWRRLSLVFRALRPTGEAGIAGFWWVDLLLSWQIIMCTITDVVILHTKMDVGQSEDRTPAKHSLLYKLLGTHVGASYSMVLKRQARLPVVIIDLCAGDGLDSFESGTSSPKIIQRHSDWFKDRMGKNSIFVILIEKDRASYDKLVAGYEKNDWLIINGDSAEQSVCDRVKEYLFPKISPLSPVFIHHDPNSVTQWCLTSEYLSLSSLLTAMVTMGCNAKGVKRLKLEERLAWYENFDLLKKQVISTGGRLDLNLTALVKDQSRWAYAVSTPSVWRNRTQKDIIAAMKYWDKGIYSQWMTNESEFLNLVNELFLTKKEFADNGGIFNVA